MKTFKGARFYTFLLMTLEAHIHIIFVKVEERDRRLRQLELEAMHRSSHTPTRNFTILFKLTWPKVLNLALCLNKLCHEILTMHKLQLLFCKCFFLGLTVIAPLFLFLKRN